MKVSCRQHHFLLVRFAPARQAGYAKALGRLFALTFWFRDLTDYKLCEVIVKLWNGFLLSLVF